MMNYKFKVIVADDEKLIAQNIARKIEQVNPAFEVIAQTQTGLETLELTMKLLPDVIFSDIKMPEMDGLELIERLKKQYPSALTVIISGYSDFEYVRTALKNSAVDYLLKPIDTEELNATLNRLEATLLARNQMLSPRRESSPADMVENIMTYLRENYAKPIDFSAIANEHAVSGSYLTKIFREHAGTTPTKFLTEYRILVAKRLLSTTELSVKEIAPLVGYPDPFYFSKAFKNVTGMSPLQYRETSK